MLRDPRRDRPRRGEDRVVLRRLRPAPRTAPPRGRSPGRPPRSVGFSAANIGSQSYRRRAPVRAVVLGRAEPDGVVPEQVAAHDQRTPYAARRPVRRRRLGGDRAGAGPTSDDGAGATGVDRSGSASALAEGGAGSGQRAPAATATAPIARRRRTSPGSVVGGLRGHDCGHRVCETGHMSPLQCARPAGPRPRARRDGGRRRAGRARRPGRRRRESSASAPRSTPSPAA